MACTEPVSADKLWMNAASKMPIHKYRVFPPIPFDDKWTQREWPSKQILRAPRWCSVDLRDGNQALINPMDLPKKERLFRHLVKMGYKEIEVGFPAASQIDFDFCRLIIEQGLVPDDVWVSVLVQSRESLIKRTIEALKGAKNVIVHIYNSTSTLQRKVVFRMGQEGISDLAVEGTKLIKSLVDKELRPLGARVRLEYSPESFTGTELDFALDVCHRVCETWEPTEEDPLILNLPATVEMAGPNVYADQIEWMHKHIKCREKVLISVHPHNDRGTAVAAAELALMAGADRVEGCLFGNGERTGNVCLVTLAVNLFTQGVDPEVDISDVQTTIDVAEDCTELRVPERYPWVGSLVYTAFSGSHQDAIKKGMLAMQAKEKEDPVWEVPYLPVDPIDLGRSYEAIVRINSQSGKGGVAFVVERELGVELPRDFQIEFAQVIQKISDATAREIQPQEIMGAFQETYLECKGPLRLVRFALEIPESFTPQTSFSDALNGSGHSVHSEANGTNGIEKPHANGTKEERPKGKGGFIEATLEWKGEKVRVSGWGNGPLDAFVSALNGSSELGSKMGLGESGQLQIASYSQAALGKGSYAAAICFLQMSSKRGIKRFGVGKDVNTSKAGILAVVSGINRLVAQIGSK
mmetsp:Transcript_23310/g.45863  ORF Transcript_23310/g.45863 Transcript_23310/m.45863 type:complete len:638 (-) Transcript_23310:677-2590(-)